MKKIFIAVLLTLFIATPVKAQGEFTASVEPTLIKGEELCVNCENAVDDIIVVVHNLDGGKLWEKTYDVSDKIYMDFPEHNPLTGIILHIYSGDVEKVLKVDFIEPHHHVGHLVAFVRPTETEAGNLEYFLCDCGKAFEDRACTVEITEPVETWAYLAPVPKSEWREGDPVPYISEHDDKNITDPNKPNPTWSGDKVKDYYEKKEIRIQNDLAARLDDDSVDQEIGKKNLPEVFEEASEEVSEEPIVLSVTSAEKTDLTIWEKIKLFFINLFD